jgi:hypothetical protein
MKTRHLVLAAFCLAPLAALSQWVWVDNAGHKVFSDRAPPTDIAADHIIRQPGGRAQVPAPAPAAAPVAAAAAAPGLPRPSGKDQALEARRKQAEAAEAAKRKAEDEKLAAAREDSCKRARAAKASFESGVRIARTNEKGEREILDDQQRAAELQRIEGVIAADCRQLQ